MKHFPPLALAAAIVVSTATTGVAQQLPGWAEQFGVAEQAAGRQVFNNHCVACHALKPSVRGFGPSLYGVVGRPAGSLLFPYSDALKGSGLTWTEDNLRKWIGNNAAVVPGTFMPHVSISDPAEQIYLVAFLRTLKEPPRSTKP